jgi:hypothetical protein
MQPAEESVDVTGSLKLWLHIKENNIQYLIGLLVAHQMGILENLYTYGSGVCS